jgi:hypothetical protein
MNSFCLMDIDHNNKLGLNEIIFIEVHCISDGYYGLLNFKQFHVFHQQQVQNDSLHVMTQLPADHSIRPHLLLTPKVL